MAEDLIILLSETFTLIAVLFAFIIFARLAIKATNLGSFRFQLSIFLLVWVVSELPHIADSLGLISISEYDPFGLTLHAASMALFAFFVGFKSYHFFTTRPPTTKVASPLPSTPARPLGDMEI